VIFVCFAIKPPCASRTGCWEREQIAANPTEKSFGRPENF
jgi:hypothetical protein